MPLILIWLVPVSHEVACVNLAQRSPQFDATGVAAWARAHPDDVGAALDAALTGTDDDAEAHSFVPVPRSDELAARFPQEAWLAAFCAARRLSSFSNVALTPVRRANAGVLSLRAELERGEKREPDNAFWLVARAQWQWAFAPRPLVPLQKARLSSSSLAGPSAAPLPPGVAALKPSTLVPDDVGVLRTIVPILAQARRCTRYDDGRWEARRALARTRAKRFGWTLEEQMDAFSSDQNPIAPNGNPILDSDLAALNWLGSQSDAPLNSVGALPPNVGRVYVKPFVISFHPSPSLENLSLRQRMELGLSIAHIGVLIDEAKQTINISGPQRPSMPWLLNGLSLDVVPAPVFSSLPPRPPGGNSISLPGIASTSALDFGVRAQKHGFGDLAGEARGLQARKDKQDALWNIASARQFDVLCGAGMPVSFYGVDTLLPRWAFESAARCFMLASGIWSLALGWMFLNIFLLRGRGAASSKSARWWPALGCVAPVVVFGCFFGSGFANIAGFGGAILIGSLLSLWCATNSARRHRAALEEAAFDRWNTSLLPPRLAVWSAPCALWAGVAVVLLGALIALSTPFFTFGTAFTSLGPVTQNIIGRWIMLYGEASFTLALLFWLGSWRFGWKLVRPLAHGALRWWKETLGASICVLLWLYLGLALAAWPARAQAKRMLEQRWEMGDRVWLAKQK